MLTESEIEQCGQERPPVDVAEWRNDALAILRRHRRQDGISSIAGIVGDGLLDAFDILAIVPELVGEEMSLCGMEAFDRQRLAHLDAMKLDYRQMRRDGLGAAYLQSLKDAERQADRVA